MDVEGAMGMNGIMNGLNGGAPSAVHGSSAMSGVGGGGGSLKRCSSAPLIGPSDAPVAPQPPLQLQLQLHQTQPQVGRARRFSTSFSPLPQPHSPSSSGPRLTPRVSQLRQEECADVTNLREVAHERETHSAMQMSQSWEDLTLMTGGSNGCNGPMSPTRARFSPGVSPSPTRRAFATRRSLSPIAMRPSCLSPASRLSSLVPMKRRFDLDEGPNPKKWCWSVDRMPTSTPGTPDSADSPSGFTFRPVSPRAQSSSSSARDQTSHGPS